ncbi:hypothetical protein K439DRAFT_1613847 [Ramaria rubella]|nr:hypothetical protein K439DRAFT_1613847 [Ramaria rubella]
MRVAWLTEQGQFTFKAIKVRAGPAGKDGKDRTIRPFFHPTFEAIIILVVFIPMDSIAHLESGPLNPISLETLTFTGCAIYNALMEYTTTGSHTTMPMEGVVYQKWTWLHSNALTWSELKAPCITQASAQGINGGSDDGNNMFINDDMDSDKGDGEAQVTSEGVNEAPVTGEPGE